MATATHESLSSEEEMRVVSILEEAEPLSVLSELEKTVLNFYYGVGKRKEMSLEEMGNILGVTRERLRQLRDEGLRKVHERIETQKELNALSF